MKVEIDRLHLMALVGDDAETVAFILDDFLENSLELLERIGAAITRCDELVIREAAHQLKGSSGMFGMQSLSTECAELETLPVGDISGARLLQLREVLVKSHQLASAVVVG